MHISKIRILPNYRKPWALRLAKTISAFLRNHGFIIAHKNVDATICIGGDGTIFYANHRSRISGAVLGIGSKTSIVCQLKNTNWKNYLVGLLRKGKVEKRQRLLANLNKKSFTSMNDIVLHTHNYRLIRIFVEISNKRYSFEGDGLIVSTPTGSSAYAYSAGGSVISPTAKNIQVVPICPYKRTIRPMLLSDSVKIKISADRSSDLIIDGIFIMRLRAKQTVTILKGKEILFLA